MKLGLLLVAVAPGACGSSSGAQDGGTQPGGDAQTDAHRSDAQAAEAGGETGQTLCMDTGAGCECSSTADGTLPACGVSTVSAGGASGFCCDVDDPSIGAKYCACQRIECHTRTADAYCICTGPMPMEGTLGANCNELQAANPSVICCLDATACVCSTQPCSFVGQQVASCSAAPVGAAICNGYPMVDSCR